jgi:undecaprenyl diphosphate synthase
MKKEREITLDAENLPAHIAIIMDGNGRWAKKHFLTRKAGHKAGAQALRKLSEEMNDRGFRYLTIYAFSTENWKRSAAEVTGIFRLLVTYVNSELKELVEKNVKVKVLGDYTTIPKEAQKSLEKTLKSTEDNTGLQFNIALNYGGRDEVRRAVQAIAREIKEGAVEPEQITEDMIGANLFTGSHYTDTPDPELVIRTSGEKRLSNYLIWQCAYSEFVFSDVLWPDYTPGEYEKSIEEYQSRDRRFGGR